MRCDKLSLEVCGTPLLRRVRDALAPRCEEILVVGGGGRSVPLEGSRRVPDVRPGRQGPLAGLEAGLAAAHKGLVFVAAGDMPFVPRDLVGYLLGLIESRGVLAAVPLYAGRMHPLCAAFDRQLLPSVSAALDEGVRAVREFLEGHGGAVLRVEVELRRFGDPGVFLMNVNAPGDLERARASCGGPG